MATTVIGKEELPMPWKEIKAMDQRVQFIADWLSGKYTKVGLCDWYGISRPTGDKWIYRYKERGVDGLKELSRCPHERPNATPAAVCERIVQMKLRHPSFGPKKVLDRLKALEPERRWPVDSTAGEILKRAGLVKARRRRHRTPADSHPLSSCVASNQSWSTDFKGDFRLGEGKRCYPLTITDNHSRFLLQCRGLIHPSTEAVKPWFEWVFREYGLPQVLRSDNGAPFASRAVGGLSALSAWWIRLGIRPERTRPATPSDNGRHERMHRSLKEAVITPPARTLAKQQCRFDDFVHEYNWERSHESLQRNTPGTVHQPSPRAYPTKLADIEYDESVFTVRRVRRNGEFRWGGQLIYLSQVLAKEPIGLRPLDGDQWEIRYSFHRLGTLDGRTQTILTDKHWHGKKTKRKPCPRSVL